MGRVHRVPRPDRRRDPAQPAVRRAPRRVRVRHHLRHEQRVRLRLPARQHGVVEATSWCSAGHNFAIVDEVDSILIDEARTPLIISGPAEQSARWYGEFARRGRPAAAAARTARATTRSTSPSAPSRSPSAASAKVEDRLGIDNLYESVNTPLVGYLNNAHQGQGALQARQGLHRQRRRGPDRRRVHRPHPARPPLQRGHAPGDRGQGGRRDQAGEPDPRHDHPAELLPPLREALRHDRYGADRGRRVQQGLQGRRGDHPDPPPDGPRSTSPDVIYKTEKAKFNAVVEDIVERHATGPAGPGRHGLGGELRDPVAAAAPPGHPARGAQREVPRQGGRDHRPGRPQGRGHRRDQHGRPRHRHPARRQPRVPGRGRAAPARPRPGGEPGGVRDGAGGGPARAGRSRATTRPRRSSTPAASTCWAPSGTSPAASTTSCAAAPAGRATRASPGSTCRCRTS